jgi:hypothetical protein
VVVVVPQDLRDVEAGQERLVFCDLTATIEVEDLQAISANSEKLAGRSHSHRAGWDTCRAAPGF